MSSTTLLDRNSEMVSEQRMNDRNRLAGHPIARMNGAGNAILVLDLRGTPLVVTAQEARSIAGLPGLRFDQLMVIHDATSPGTDAHMRIYNTDGSQSGACGNGSRCVAWVLLRESPKDSLLLTTQAGEVECHKVGEFGFSVDMGTPVLAWDAIPLRDGDPASLDLGDIARGMGRPFAVGMGNPHAVFFVRDTAALDLATIGPPLEHAPAFPERANISFAQIVDAETIKLRVWERGAGATLACGTGACATLVAAASTGRTGRSASVDLPGGRLDIVWRADDHVVMTGPVELEFETFLPTTFRGEQAA